MLYRLFPLLALASPLFAQDGQQLFTLYCSACHGPDGKGATGGTFPPLAGSPWVAGEADRATKIALKGLAGPVNVLGKTYNLEMPPQGAVLSDDQLAAILTYVRSAWGNQSGAVAADFVKKTRASVEDRKTSWTAEEILRQHPLPLEKTALTNLISHAYSGKWNNMPDFSTIQAANVEEEHDGVISLKKAPFEDNFAILWQGGFEAPADGEYQFIIDADDAGAVIVDGKTVAEVKGAGPINAGRAREGKITLTKGNHPIRVEFLEITDKQGIALGWKGPGGEVWNWLSDTTVKPPQIRERIVIAPTGDRPVIYRNFITGTTPRAIGVGFPGGLNMAYSADDLAPELIWTGAFIDGAPKWLERGTDNNPPAGENVVHLTKGRFLPKEARFRGYKLDAKGNPTFSVQIGNQILLDSWHAENGTLVRKLTLSGKGEIDGIVLGQNLRKTGSRYNLDDKLFIEIGNASTDFHKGTDDLSLTPGQPVTLTYLWK